MTEKEKVDEVVEESVNNEEESTTVLNENESSNENEANIENESLDISSLKSELEKLTNEKEDLFQKVLRIQADFENYKRRTKKERENDLKYKSQELAVELLPVLDNFERALQVEATDEVMKNFVDGMSMIYRQVLQALNKAGVEEIQSLGEQFDPHLHQAVMQVSEEDKESNTVVEVFQKGYTLKDRVIRPAMVKVNQ